MMLIYNSGYCMQLKIIEDRNYGTITSDIVVKLCYIDLLKLTQQNLTMSFETFPVLEYLH